ncbi:MAG: hypothetical protein BWX81_01481 [Spirochaetes bacterium ADurb.Bin110]|nr:MAG: hypothetical protein BWX81_01481 [Spirochaetes bacterium ADurb.Bin110]
MLWERRIEPVEDILGNKVYLLERVNKSRESDRRKSVRIHYGEFDPGSEQTLAACLKHAS